MKPKTRAGTWDWTDDCGSSLGQETAEVRVQQAILCVTVETQASNPAKQSCYLYWNVSMQFICEAEPSHPLPHTLTHTGSPSLLDLTQKVAVAYLW